MTTIRGITIEGYTPSDQEAGLAPDEVSTDTGLLKTWKPFLAEKVEIYGEVHDLSGTNYTHSSADGTYVHDVRTDREGLIFTKMIGNYRDNTLTAGDDHTIELFRDYEYSHNTQLFGMNGHDTLYGGRLGDVLSGGRGNDQIWGDGGNDTITGGYGNDSIRGGEGNDTIFAGRDNDWVKGGDGNDTIFGGTGSDTIDGGTGNDAILGEAGDDVITGGSGNDTIYGDDGHDVLNGGAGVDYMEGGSGNDFLFSGSMLDHTGVEYMYGGDDDDTFIIGDGNADYTSDYLLDISAAFPEQKGTWTSVLDTLGLGVAAYEPLKAVGGALKTIAAGFEAIYEHSAPDPQTTFNIPADWGSVGEVHVMDFNPFKEQVLIPLNDVLKNGSLDTDIDIIFPDQNAGESFAFKVVDNRGNQNAEIAVVEWDPDLIDNLPDYMTVNNLGEALAPEKYDAIRESLKASMLYYNGDTLHVGGSERSGDLEGAMAGSGNAYFGVGAFGGFEIYDNVTENSSWVGTAFGDTIGAFVPEHIDSTSIFNAFAEKDSGSTLYGLDGDDVLFGGAGDDRIYGGEGDGDFVAYYDAESVIVDMNPDGTTDGVSYFNSNATYKSESGTKTVTDEDANFEIENVIGSNGDDVITGNGSANTIDGADGNDMLDGAGGNDILDGGAGFDELWGGDGADAFIFADGDHQYFSNTKLGADIDRVMDFEIGEDTIYIDVSSFDQTKVDSIDDIFVAQVDGDSYLNYAFEKDTGQTNFHTVAVVEDALLTTSDIALYDDALFA